MVWNGAILLHFHEKLGRWLPPGGHIEPNEIPDHAAHREVLEETGIEITLVGDQLNTIDISGQPRQCCRPAGVQIATIRPGHEHVDLIYFARSEGGEPHENAGWFGPDSWSVLQLTAEVQTWCELAIESVDKWARKSSRVRT